jgi:subtilisin family serine protease
VKWGLGRGLRRVGALAGALLSILSVLLAGCAGVDFSPVTASPASSGGPSAMAGAAAQGDPAKQVMVTYPAGPPPLWARITADLAQTYNLRTIFSWTMGSIGEHCVVFEVPRGRSVAEMVQRLSSDPRIGVVQPLLTFDTQAAGRDPYAHLQHGSQTLHVDQAHRLATGKGVRVAVIDTGVDFDHPDLRGQVVKANNFVDVGEGTFTADVHGTAVAGLIAASANNDIGIVGVAPGAEIYALKACWPRAPGSREAQCNSYTLAKAVDFAILQGAQVLNFSLAGPEDPLLGKLVGAALSRGIVVVAADGGAPGRSFPATYKGVLGVLGSDDLKGGLARPDERSPASAPELAAPGIDILSTAPHNSYDFFSGSSLAAAQVTGIAALLLERNPKLTPAQIRDIVRKTAHPLAATPGLTGGHAPPIIQADACAAVASVAGGEGCS